MQHIYIDPDPPQKNKPLKICYDFNGSGVTKTELAVSFKNPNSGPTSYPVNTTRNCFEIQCPAADSILIEDEDGPSADFESPIT